MTHYSEIQADRGIDRKGNRQTILAALMQYIKEVKVVAEGLASKNPHTGDADCLQGSAPQSRRTP